MAPIGLRTGVHISDGVLTRNYRSVIMIIVAGTAEQHAGLAADNDHAAHLDAVRAGGVREVTARPAARAKQRIRNAGRR
jgi:hypothetical protein